jgi:hypothetical protein
MVAECPEIGCGCHKLDGQVVVFVEDGRPHVARPRLQEKDHVHQEHLARKGWLVGLSTGELR